MIGPGDKVVCVDDDWICEFDPRGSRFPRVGDVCTVVCEELIWGFQYIGLAEINPDDAFLASHFRKLDITRFRDMAKNADTLPVTERKEVTV